ncbi:hypothetical protein GCM10017621_16030 [Maricaulis virginensis]|uniref:Uncharacterized protein n=1 Tax=Maricaulis virginensis TaxID=144022 RepID=A0A9W6IN41_9PROT|nr:hypothetical protein [Maricaulis virginensis]GLK52095.1 hypothetical protein GCM10017621_16030 [Maricaulis virginensis]
MKGELPVKVPVFQFRDREAELGFDTFPRFGPAPPPIVQAGKIALAAEATDGFNCIFDPDLEFFARDWIGQLERTDGDDLRTMVIVVGPGCGAGGQDDRYGNKYASEHGGNLPWHGWLTPCEPHAAGGWSQLASDRSVTCVLKLRKLVFTNCRRGNENVGRAGAV